MRIWQQDEAGKNQVGQGENGGYLFDRVQQTDGTYTVNTAQGAAGAGGARHAVGFLVDALSQDVDELE